MYFPFCRAPYPQNDLSGLVTHRGEVFMDFDSLPAHSGQRCNSTKDCARATQGLARAGRGPSSASCPLTDLAQTRIFSCGLTVGLLKQSKSPLGFRYCLSTIGNVNKFIP